MDTFIQKHQNAVIGKVSGFDRMVFRGRYRALSHTDGLLNLLGAFGILLKDFGQYVEGVSTKLKASVQRMADANHRPVIYLPSSAVRKDERAHEIASREGITEGLVCVLTCVEPCWTYLLFRNRKLKKLELRRSFRKCLHLYGYWLDDRLGRMSVRLQSWFPFDVQVCLNGREWLGRQLTAAGVAHLKEQNCFPWIENVVRAQRLMDEQLQTSWPELLESLVARLHPGHATLLSSSPSRYYWTLDQSEWATDVMFRSTGALAAIYPRLTDQAIRTFHSQDVLRFLGRRIPSSNQVPAHFSGEVVSDVKRRPEGLRVRHRLNANSVKLYDKQGRILRVETTINDPKDFLVFRRPEGKPTASQKWLPLRKGIADIQRRTQLSQAANDRYLAALAATEDETPLRDLLDVVCRPTRHRGRRARALRPFASDDRSLLDAVSAGEFAIGGARNRDVRRKLFGKAADRRSRRRQSAAIGRRLRLLRAHRLIRRVPKTHRYVVTERGRVLTTALRAAADANTKTLMSMAA